MKKTYKVLYESVEFYVADSKEEAKKMFMSDGHLDDEIISIED